MRDMVFEELASIKELLEEVVSIKELLEEVTPWTRFTKIPLGLKCHEGYI